MSGSNPRLILFYFILFRFCVGLARTTCNFGAWVTPSFYFIFYFWTLRELWHFRVSLAHASCMDH